MFEFGHSFRRSAAQSFSFVFAPPSPSLPYFSWYISVAVFVIWQRIVHHIQARPSELSNANYCALTVLRHHDSLLMVRLVVDNQAPSFVVANCLNILRSSLSLILLVQLLLLRLRLQVVSL
jgi:hypothetical protein